MSILIKGMKMPKNCTICRFCVPEADPEHGVMCMATGRYMPPCSTDRLDDCPLVLVPTPHGRLIDADEIIEVQMFDEMYEEWTLKTMTVDDYLAFAADIPPTIIEAEEGAEE